MGVGIAEPYVAVLELVCPPVPPFWLNEMDACFAEKVTVTVEDVLELAEA